MRALVALDLPGGTGFLDALRMAWDDGDAVLPLDPRLPDSARQQILEVARPHRIVGPDGASTHLDRSAPLLEDDDALVVATSGTTGAPKAIVHTLTALRAHAEAVSDRLAIDPDRDRWLACLPLAHIGGLGVVLRSLLTGTPCDVLAGFDAAAVTAAPSEFGSTLVSLVPTALDRIDATAYRHVVLGGAADPKAERASNVVATYGLTETGGGVVYDGFPLRDVEVRIAPDRTIELRTPTVARGHRGVDGEVVPLVDGDGWFRTGDVGRLSEPAVAGGERRLEVDGRVDDLVVTGGQNVWPEVVESVLLRHPAVAEVAVFGRPDREWGQVVVAAIVPNDPEVPPSLDELKEFARQELPAYASPKAIEFRDSLPRTALGKVRRRVLAGESTPER